MKKLLFLAMMLFGAIMVTSTPASAQVFVGIGGHHGPRITVGVGGYGHRYNAPTCRDYYGRPVYCNPPAPVYDYGYGCDYGYDCGPVVNYGGIYYGDRYRYYNDYRRDYRRDYWRNDYNRGRGDWNRGGDWGRGRGNGGGYRHH